MCRKIWYDEESCKVLGLWMYLNKASGTWLHLWTNVARTPPLGLPYPSSAPAPPLVLLVLHFPLTQLRLALSAASVSLSPALDHSASSMRRSSARFPASSLGSRMPWAGCALARRCFLPPSVLCPLWPPCMHHCPYDPRLPHHTEDKDDGGGSDEVGGRGI